MEQTSKNRVHKYTARCSWRGSTSAGYEKYDRAHQVSAPPATTSLTLSSDPAFRGDPRRLNPEQLLVIAASSCQLLSFLAVAARARVNILEYDDEAKAEMPEKESPVRFTKIVLRPRIIVGPGVSVPRIRQLIELAHNECYIANSLKTSITIEPVVEVRENG